MVSATPDQWWRCSAGSIRPQWAPTLAHATILVGLSSLIALAHWLIPVRESAAEPFFVFHLLLRKLYLLPIILGAIWFDLPGALATALLVSLLFLPMISIPWPGMPGEHLEEWGELGSIWIVALLAGVEVHKARGLLRRLNCALECTIESLVAALDIREHGTGEHSRRVREISLWLARRLKLSGKDYEAIRHGALLHDVGKIGVPDRILLKAGPLTAEERAIMDQHPNLGMKILKADPLLADSAEIVQSHHERFDGSGYPRGLADGRIPLGARIFSVADVLDALTATDRLYRQPQSFEQARRWIEEQSGRLFDPRVVRALGEMTPEEWGQLTAIAPERGPDFRRIEPPGGQDKP